MVNKKCEVKESVNCYKICQKYVEQLVHLQIVLSLRTYGSFEIAIISAEVRRGSG